MEMKKMTLTLAVITSLAMTGCGDSASSKGGYSSPEKAAEAYREAIHSCDVEKIVNFMPKENKEYFEKEYHVTSSQMYDAIEEYLKVDLKREEKIMGKYKSFSITGKEKKDISYMQELNTRFDNFGVKSEEAYKVNCTVVYELNGEENIDNKAYLEVYEYNGRWYSIFGDSIYKNALGYQHIIN